MKEMNYLYAASINIEFSVVIGDISRQIVVVIYLSRLSDLGNHKRHRSL